MNGVWVAVAGFVGAILGSIFVEWYRHSESFTSRGNRQTTGSSPKSVRAVCETLARGQCGGGSGDEKRLLLREPSVLSGG